MVFEMGLLNTKEKKDLTDGLRFGSKVGAGLLVARILANSLLNRNTAIIRYPIDERIGNSRSNLWCSRT